MSATSRRSSPPLAAVVDTDGRIDPYRLAHKGIRLVLGRLLEAAGRTDFADRSALQGLREQSMEAIGILRTHARIEVLFIDAFLIGPCGENDLHSQHAALEAEMFALVGELEGVSGASRTDARALGHAFYLALSRFVARYYLHMADEELSALPLLHRQADDTMLRAVLAAAQSALDAGDREQARAAMADAVAPHERDAVTGRGSTSRSTAA